MANIGIGDIDNFTSKIHFALMVISPKDLISLARDRYEMSLTSVTLEAWKSGKNRPSKRKLDLVAAVLNIESADFYLDFTSFADLVAKNNDLSLKYLDIFKKRVQDQLLGRLKLNSFSRHDSTTLERLFNKIRGRYILYNYSMSNVPRVNVTLINIKTLQAPLIGTTAYCLRGGQYYHYTGTLFAVRANIHIILETVDEHDEVVMITTNNPIGSAREVRFLHGAILAGSEDSVSHPTAARVLMEKLPSNCTRDMAQEMLAGISTQNMPTQYLQLINNDLTQKNGEFVLRAEQLSVAFMEELSNVSLFQKVPGDG